MSGHRPAKKGLFPLSFALFLSLFSFSCASVQNALSKAAPPCAIYNAQIAERGVVGIELSIANLSGKKIEGAFVFACIAAESEEGEDFFEDGFEKEFEVLREMEAGCAERIFIPFDEFDFEEEIENYFVESVFVSEVIFEGGEVWHDENGEKAF